MGVLFFPSETIYGGMAASRKPLVGTVLYSTMTGNNHHWLFGSRVLFSLVADALCLMQLGCPEAEPSQDARYFKIEDKAHWCSWFLSVDWPQIVK